MKIDFHTHSILSHDGGINLSQYKQLLGSDLDVIAITDHNKIDFALKAHAELGDKVIVGEEIKTNEGEIIGLYLKKFVPNGLSLIETVKKIKAQGGLVYVPHPFESRRHGLSEESIRSISQYIDIIEVFNSRTLSPSLRIRAENLAKELNIVVGAGSDSHHYRDMGQTYTLVSSIPSCATLVELLKTSEIHGQKAKKISFVRSNLNKVRNKLFGIRHS